MSLDERLRQGLEGLDALEGSPPDAVVDAIVGRGRRSRWIRRVAAGAVALAAAIAVIVLVPSALDALWSGGTKVPAHQGTGMAPLRVQGYGFGFSADGTRLFARALDSSGAIYDAETGALVQTASGRGDLVAAFSPDGSLFVTVQGEPACCHTSVHETATGRELLDIQRACCFAAFSPDGSLLAIPRAGRTRVVEVESGDIANEFAPWGAMAFSPDGERLLVSPFPEDAAKGVIAYVYDVHGGREAVLSLRADSGGGNVPSVYFDWQAWSADGSMVAVPTSIGDVIIWDARTGAELFEIARPHARFISTAFSSGDLLATGARNGTAVVWSLAGDVAQEFSTIKAYDRRVDHVVFDPRGRLMTAAWNRPTKIWNLSE
jgi:WD40 repeat protein